MSSGEARRCVLDAGPLPWLVAAMRLLAAVMSAFGLTTTGPAVAPSVVDTAAPAATLTLDVGGDLFRYGGVVVVYPIPTPAKVEAAGDPKPLLRLGARYAQVQLRYPAGGSYTFRFRPAEKGPGTAIFQTQLLTVIGTDEKDRGPLMQEGFAGAYSSGGQVIRVLPRDEWGGEDEATRSNARWGKTQLYADPPPADGRSARALVSVVDDPMRRVPLRCEGDGRVQACTVAAERWPAIEALWWRAIAEQRLDLLYDHALRRCQESHVRTCRDDPDADEPQFQ